MPKVPRYPVSDAGTKVCTACLLEKPVADFYVRNRSTGRLDARCRPCHLERTSAYAKATRPQRAAYSRKWSADHAETEKARRYQQYWADPERARGYTARFRVRHAERLAVARRLADNARYAANPEPIREQRRRERIERADRIAAARRKFYLANKPKIYAEHHRRRAKLRGSGGTWTPEQWRAINVAQDFRCLMCRRREPEIRLTVDHIVPVRLGGRNDAANLQGLCKPCNSRKGLRILDLRSQELT